MTDRRSLPFPLWPEVHRQRWQSMTNTPDAWLGASGITAWAPCTRIGARKSYGRLLQWLLDHDLLEPGPPQNHQFRMEVLKQFIASDRRFVKWATLSTQLFDLIGAFESMMPDDDWSELREIRNSIQRLARQEPPQQPRIVHAGLTLELGFGLMRQALGRNLEDDAAVDLYVDGLLISMLTLIYLRIGNFTALELGRHLKRADGVWHLAVSAEETKNNHADNGALADFLTSWLDYFVDVVRPALTARARLGSDTDRLWLDAEGRLLTDQAIRKRIKRRTKEAFGFAICPHTFRKIALTTFVIERPEYAAWGPALLRHHSPKTAEQHYFVAQRQLAVETYHKVRRMQRRRATGEAHAEATGTLSEQIQLLVLCSALAPESRPARKHKSTTARPARRRRSRLGRLADR
jgi:hypothetical protein